MCEDGTKHLLGMKYFPLIGAHCVFLGSAFQFLFISLTNSNQRNIYVVLRILGSPFLDVRFLSYVSICNGVKRTIHHLNLGTGVSNF